MQIWTGRLGVISNAECFLCGQVCSSLTRLIVSRRRHDELRGSAWQHVLETVVGNAFDSETQMGPLAMERQLSRVQAFGNSNRYR